MSIGQQLKIRLLTGWNARRILFLVAGIWTLSEARAQGEILLALPGAYFALMGLLAFGCASGNCGYTPPGPAGDSAHPADYEEIKADRP